MGRRVTYTFPSALDALPIGRDVVLHLHSVTISDLPKWLTLFRLQKFKYISNLYNLYNLKTKNANYLKF